MHHGAWFGHNQLTSTPFNLSIKLVSEGEPLTGQPLEGTALAEDAHAPTRGEQERRLSRRGPMMKRFTWRFSVRWKLQSLPKPAMRQHLSIIKKSSAQMMTKKQLVLAIPLSPGQAAAGKPLERAT